MDVAKIISDLGGFLTNDHFVYSSGKHGDTYINKNDLLLHPKIMSEICSVIANRFQSEAIDCVVGPAIGGICMAQWTAYHLSNLTGREVFSLFAEKNHEKMFSFTRGYDPRIADKNILLVDDLVNSSSTATTMIATIQKNGGTVVGFSVMINRNPREVNAQHFGSIPFAPLCEVDVIAYDAANCPLCKKHFPVNTTVGHGRAFVDSKKQRG